MIDIIAQKLNYNIKFKEQIMSFEDNLSKILGRHKELGEKLGTPMSGEEFGKVSKEYSDLNDIVEKINDYQKISLQIEDLSQMLDDEALDQEMRDLCYEELKELEEKFPSVERRLQLSLLPKDEADAKNAIIEIRAGTGGEEAALFAAILFRMYQKYAERNKWKFEILSISDTGIGGYKDASASISGENVFAKLKFEAGAHRVQRVPETESSGRIHTSAATVAVLPEAEEIDVKIEDKDIRIDTFRASGAGGQHVNTTDSAVRITHIPTGIVVSQQDEKSQHKNKAKALKILRARIYEAEREKLNSEIAASRKGQVGSGDRSERIRTYNFPQSRVTDHRINMTLYKMDEIINEGNLDEFIDALIADDEAKRLAGE
jgi:peptide chain release factor 1